MQLVGHYSCYYSDIELLLLYCCCYYADVFWVNTRYSRGINVERPDLHSVMILLLFLCTCCNCCVFKCDCTECGCWSTGKHHYLFVVVLLSFARLMGKIFEAIIVVFTLLLWLPKE